MTNDRKYRQGGYRPDSNTGSSKREPPPGSRPSGMLPTRPVSRCAACGVVLPIMADSLTECPSCRGDLHTCQQCSHFDPAQRFECAQPIMERVGDKRAPNDCGSFALRVIVERNTTSPGSIRPDDARRTFGNLFKK